MSAAIAIFVKTPSLSPLKTRLAATIGQDKAHEFYQLSLDAICETLTSVDIIPYWAIAEEEGLNDPVWGNYACLHTGEGNLGVRQYHIYESLLNKHDQVLLIGSDAPQLSSEIIQRTITVLDEGREFVIGPAHDGGYYLFGGTQTTDRAAWEDTPWSANDTRDKLINALPSQVAMLDFLTDIDMQDDLRHLSDEMPASMNAAQSKLLEWMDTL